MVEKSFTILVIYNFSVGNCFYRCALYSVCDNAGNMLCIGLRLSSAVLWFKIRHHHSPLYPVQSTQGQSSAFIPRYQRLEAWIDKSNLLLNFH